MKHLSFCYHILFLLSTCILFTTRVAAQEFVESEKVFVSTDRHVYTPGERLSFSVFVVDEQHEVQKSSAMIKVLLADGKDQVLDSMVAHVLNGRFSYYFMLPRKGGIYRVKASTRWQLNERKPKQFQKEIYVQELVQKRFFIKQELTKTNYQQGDTINSDLTFTKRGNEPMDGVHFEASLIVNGQPLNSLNRTANPEGKSTIQFVLPNRKMESAYVKVTSHYQGNTEYIMTRVPLQQNDIHIAVHSATGMEYLVAGIQNRWVVESFDVLGNPKDISGYIVDKDGNQVVRFKSLHKGMADVTFVPQINQKYTVVSDQVKNKVALPNVVNDKPYLSVFTQSGSLMMQSTSSQAHKVNVIVSGNGKVYLRKTINPQPDQNISKVQIALSSLPPGVYGIQFKSEEGNVIGSRLFVRRPEKLDISLETNKDQASLGQEVTVRLNTNKEQATYAIRAISEQVFNQMKDRSHSIISWMYLGSEIQSEIDEPTFYFKDEADAGKALDMLGIVKRKQWRRSFETGLVLRRSGKYYLRNSGRLSGSVYMHYAQSPYREGIKVRIKHTSFEVLTDSLGKFVFEGLPSDVIANSPVLIISKGVDRMEYPVHSGYNYFSHGFSESTNTPALGRVDQLLKKMIVPSQIDNVLKYKTQLKSNEVMKEVYVNASKNYTSNYSVDAMSVPVRSLDVIAYAYRWDFGAADGGYTLYQEDHNGYVIPFGVSLIYNNGYNRVHTYPGPIRLSNKTTYWYGEAESKSNGESTLKFYTPIKNDGVVIICEGVTASGKVFVVDKTIKVQDEVEVFTNVPSNLTVGDYANVSLDFINHSNTHKQVKYTVNLNGKQENQVVELLPGSSKAVSVSLVTGLAKRDLQLQYTYQFDNILRNSERFVIPVLHKGHHRNEMVAGKTSSGKKTIEVNKVIDGTAELKFSILNDFVDVLDATSKRMIRQPGGCFEQVSSSNYPNLLALKVLQHNMDFVQTDLISKIQSGYNKLVAYETPSKGFEWYGRNPPHTTLSAYGLLQFSLMRSLGLEIDEQMFTRNLNWLLDQRNGEGGFKHHRGKYGFSGSKDKTNDAYVTWVLSRISQNNINKEIRAIEADVEQKFDAYKVALLASIYANRGLNEKARIHLNTLETHFDKKRYVGFTTSGSIMYSGGRSLDVEIMSIALIAAHKLRSNPDAFEQNLISQIMQSQTGYGFGNTQATALALEALSNYVSFFQSRGRNQAYTVWLDGRPVIEINASNTSARQKTIVLDEAQLVEGKHTIRVECANGDQLPYTCELSWLEQVDKLEHPELAMDYTFSSTNVLKTEALIARVDITNKTEHDKPQTVAVVRIPAGLSFDMEELRLLKKEGKFDHFEATTDQLVFYFLGIKANSTTSLQIGLKPVIEGRFAPAESYVYQYYTPEIRSTILAKPVVIQTDIKP